MEIYNTTTNLIATLDYAGISDLVANDKNIIWSDSRERHEANQDTIDWWQNWIAGAETLSKMMSAIGDDQLASEIVEESQHCDMADQPAFGIKALESWAEENEKQFVTYSDQSIGLQSIS
jgi:hypothetical protein